MYDDDVINSISAVERAHTEKYYQNLSSDYPELPVYPESIATPNVYKGGFTNG